jgi:hypothetical protein
VKRAISHVSGALLEGAVVAALVGILVVGTALAGKGGGKPSGGGGSTSGGGSIHLASPITVDKDGSGTVSFGDIVEFTISTTATATPYVNLKCYQGGALVIEGWRGYFADSLDYRTFGLYGGQWAGGAADCTAWLDAPTSKGGMRQLASTSFHVDG